MTLAWINASFDRMSYSLSPIGGTVQKIVYDNHAYGRWDSAAEAVEWLTSNYRYRVDHYVIRSRTNRECWLVANCQESCIIIFNAAVFFESERDAALFIMFKDSFEEDEIIPIDDG